MDDIKFEDHNPIRWNIIDNPGSFGDEWNNWEHMEEDERFEYFNKMFTYFKKLEDFYKTHKNDNDISIIEHGLMCDNPHCGWTDDTIKFEDYPNWLNKGCPICGENVLTDRDYNDMRVLHQIIDDAKNLVEDRRLYTFSVHAHNGINISEIKLKEE